MKPTRAGRRIMIAGQWWPGKEPLERPIVYGLVDPRRPRTIRYVGATGRPRSRYAVHVGRAASSSVRAWRAKMGYLPDMVVLEECDSADLRSRETHWILQCQSRGHADLNVIANGRRVA